jgi:hypothetical protein
MPRVPRGRDARGRPTATAGVRVIGESTPRRRPPPPPPELGEHAVRWWRRVWRSPMAALWIDGDLASLERLAYLNDDLDRIRRARRGPHLAAQVQRLGAELGVNLDFLATAFEDMPTAPAPALLGQIAALEDRLGLSPAGRRRLGWVVTQADGPEAQVLTLAPDRRSADAIHERATGREPHPPHEQEAQNGPQRDPID